MVALCLLSLFEYTLFDLKHFDVISLKRNDLLGHFGSVAFEAILPRNRPHSGRCSKNPRIMLVRSNQIYPIRFEAFRRDFC